MFVKRAAQAITPLLIAAVSVAQSFNIDLHADPSIPPPATFGGYPAQLGFWNNLPAGITTPFQLSTLAPVLDDSFAFWTVPPAITGTQGGIPAPYTELYEDFAGVSDFPSQLTITQLEPGDYVAVLYSYYPGVETTFTLTSGATQSSAFVKCLSSFPGLKLGESMALISFAVAAPGAGITIDIVGGGNENAGVLNGLQLVHTIGNAGCSQQPVNSKGAVPAIAVSGTTVGGSISIAANNVMLHAGLLPGPGQLPDGVGAILCFVSNTAGGPWSSACPGEGVRCIGPSVTRVWDPNALPGTGGVGVTTGNGNYNLPVDLNVLAAHGLIIAPGAMLHFQMMYRDHNVSGVCPGTSVSRWTGSVSVQLVP